MIESKEAIWDIAYGPGPQRTVTHRHDLEFVKSYVIRDTDGRRMAWCPRCDERTILDDTVSTDSA